MVRDESSELSRSEGEVQWQSLTRELDELRRRLREKEEKIYHLTKLGESSKRIAAGLNSREMVEVQKENTRLSREV